jgi:L-rhamnose mutarotase
MYLKPGCEEEYKKRHDAIWPELKALLSDAGITNYSIYWDKKTNILFSYQELSDSKANAALAGKAIMKKWWHYMADLMAVNPDESPVNEALEEMFYME